MSASAKKGKMNSKLFSRPRGLGRGEIINTFKRVKDINKEKDSSSDDILSESQRNLHIDNEGNRIDLSIDTFMKIDDNLIDQYAIDDNVEKSRGYHQDDMTYGLINDDIDIDTIEEQEGGSRRNIKREGKHLRLSSRPESRPESRPDSRSEPRSTYKPRVIVEFEEADLPDYKVPVCREITITYGKIPDLSNIEVDPIIHEDIDYPKFAMGFNHWIHASKNKTIIFNTFANKKRVYQVVNAYERYIDDYDESIGTISKQFFKLGGKNISS